MTETDTTIQMEKDLDQIDIPENQQDLHTDLTTAQQAQMALIPRRANEKYVEIYLDGQEYDLVRITAEVKAQIGFLTQAYIEIGRRLLAVKQVEDHGKFLKWLENELKFSRRTAYNFMQVASKLEQRPELAALAKGGISKALILLDMPEEYQDEYVEEGTIDGKPVEIFHTMTRKELTAEIKKLKNNQDKIIAEETKGLEAERDALVTENKRLKKFEPVEDATPEWCLAHAQKIKNAALEVVTLCNIFSYDERLKEDIPTQARIEQNMDMARKALREFDREWNDVFNPVD